MNSSYEVTPKEKLNLTCPGCTVVSPHGTSTMKMLCHMDQTNYCAASVIAAKVKRVQGLRATVQSNAIRCEGLCSDRELNI
eukprot:999479-Amphidinium_carterae.1